MKKKLALVLAACLVVGSVLVGCGSSDGGSSDSAGAEGAGVAGTYALTGMIDSEGTETTLAEYAEANGVSESDLESSFELSEDGTGTMSTLGTETEIEWAEDGTTITMTINGQEFTYEYDESAGTLTSVGSTTGYDSVMTRQ